MAMRVFDWSKAGRTGSPFRLAQAPRMHVWRIDWTSAIQMAAIAPPIKLIRQQQGAQPFREGSHSQCASPGRWGMGTACRSSADMPPRKPGRHRRCLPAAPCCWLPCSACYSLPRRHRYVHASLAASLIAFPALWPLHRLHHRAQASGGALPRHARPAGPAAACALAAGPAPPALRGAALARPPVRSTLPPPAS